MKRHISPMSSREDSESASPGIGRSLALWTLCFLSVLFNLASVSLLALLGSILAGMQQKVAVLALIALAVNLLSLCLFLALAWKEASASHFQPEIRARRVMTVCFSLILSSLAAAISLATAVWVQIEAGNLEPFLFHSPSGLVAGLVAAAVLAGICQLLFLALLALSPARRGGMSSDMPNGSMPEITILSRSVTARSKSTVLSNPFTTRTELSSPPLSPSTTSLPSIPSRTGSNTGRSSGSRPTSTTPTDSSQLDFAWDTSSVPAALRDTVHSRNTVFSLPPIPGSRPASPAKALDGPFLPPSPHPPQSQPSSPTQLSHPRPVSQQTEAEEPLPLPHAPFMTASPSRSRNGSVISRNRSSESLYLRSVRRTASCTSLAESVSHLTTSPSFDEDHIHPLFRSSSPSPAPNASKNTVVTAASVTDAEEIAITGARKRSYSRPGSPLAHEAEWMGEDFAVPASPPLNLANPDIFVSLEEHAPASRLHLATTQHEPEAEAEAAPKKSSETVSTLADSEAAPSTEGSATVVPRPKKEKSPIPTFVLAAGQRDSMVNFEARQRRSSLGDDDRDSHSDRSLSG